MAGPSDGSTAPARAVLLASLIAASCGRPPSPTPPEVLEHLERLASSITFAGCAQVRAGPVCELHEPAVIHVWIPDPGGAEVTLGGAVPTPVAVPDGLGFRMSLGPSSQALTVDLTLGGATRRWALPVLPVVEAPHLREATALRRAGDGPGAEAVLAAAEGEPSPRALALSARLALDRGDRALAVERLAAAGRAAAELGAISQATDDALARAYVLTLQLRRFEDAEAALAEARRAASRGYGDGMANLPYYEALLARERGDLRLALRRLEDAELAAGRLGLERLGWSARQTRATTLQWLGHTDLAVELLTGARSMALEDGTPCDRANLLTNLGWAALLAREQAAASPPPGPILEEALALYEGTCARPARAANVRVNLALASLGDDRPSDARAHLEAARRAVPDPALEDALWWFEVEGRIAQREERPRLALEAYRRLAHLADLAQAPDHQFRAALGEARALGGLGRSDAALAAYQRAETRLDDLALRIPVDRGRDTFIAGRDESARELVALLVARGRAEEALRVAQRSRRRLLDRLSVEHGLGALSPEARATWDRAIGRYGGAREALGDWARARWRLPADQLRRAEQERERLREEARTALDEAVAALGAAPAPEPRDPPPAGELRLTYFPGPAGWIGFAETPRGARAVSLSPLELGAAPEALAQQLLGPFRAELEASERVRLLPYGALRAVDLHALPWGGAPLQARRLVVYDLDLTLRGPPREASASALVVADPRGDLAGARREARDVADVLTSAGFGVRILAGPEATRGAVLRALGEVGLLHYAGHGVFAGAGGFESALPLAGGEELTVGDILALGSVPAEVVLSGCETARSRAEGAEGMGLAQAFVTAGSQTVIAASRPVGDEAARAISVAYHRRRGEEPAAALAGAVRDLPRELAPDGPAFRVLVPRGRAPVPATRTEREVD